MQISDAVRGNPSSRNILQLLDEMIDQAEIARDNPDHPRCEECQCLRYPKGHVKCGRETPDGIWYDSERFCGFCNYLRYANDTIARMAERERIKRDERRLSEMERR